MAKEKEEVKKPVEDINDPQAIAARQAEAAKRRPAKAED